MNRMQRNFDHKWHCALNQFNCEKDVKDFQHWMYEAKRLWQEIPRLKILFKLEREGNLPKIHKQCSLSPEIPIPENYLTCCLGIKCLKCPELQALKFIQTDNVEQIDEAKAYTCATHIISKGGDVGGEGYIVTVDDRMFWDNVCSSLRQGEPCP